MLTKEDAEKRLKEFEATQSELDAGKKSRFHDALMKLPEKAQGETIATATEQPSYSPFSGLEQGGEIKKVASYAAFDLLTPKERATALAVPFPKMHEAVERAWCDLRAFSYQTGYQVAGFRSPRAPQNSLTRRIEWFRGMMRIAEKYQEQLLTPNWLATWAPYIKTTWYGDEKQIGMLLASVISAGGKEADEVFSILRDSLTNQHEIGAMGRHVILAFLMSSREEGWELIEKTLIAAQRQEGLRQSILESIDMAHLGAFQRMLKLLVEHDLARFSSVARAVDVWFGFMWDSASVKTVNTAIERAILNLEDEKTRLKALKGDDPEAADMALWAIAMEDAEASIAPAGDLLKHKTAEMRFVGVRHLERLQLAAATLVKWQASDDEDLRVAARATNIVQGTTPADAFERLERFLQRIPEKPIQLAPIVWPWTGRSLSRESEARSLLNVLNDRPPTALLPYVEMMESWGKRNVLDLFSHRTDWESATRAMLVRSALDISQDVRAAALEALKKVELTNEELVLFRGALTRKAADLRLGIIDAILRRDDAACLASVEDLLQAKDAQQRLAGLELARRMIAAKRSVDACRKLAEAFSERRKCSKDETTQLDAILARETEAPKLTLENALGLMDGEKRTKVVAPVRVKVSLHTAESKAFVLAIDELVHEHRELPVKASLFSQELRPLGSLQWGFPTPNFRESTAKELKRLPHAAIWTAWQEEQMKKPGAEGGLWSLRGYASWSLWRFGREPLKNWAKNDPNRQAFYQSYCEAEFGALRYGGVVRDLLQWFLYLNPAERNAEFLLDAATMFASLVPSEALADAQPEKEPKKRPHLYYYGSYHHDQRAPWRGSSGPTRVFLNLVAELGCTLSGEQIERKWKLERWLDEPLEGAIRNRPDNASLIQAYLHGAATLHDVADGLLGPRPQRDGYLSQFSLLSELTARKLSPERRKLILEKAEVRELVENAVKTIVDTELARGETPTPATAPAQEIGSIDGLDRLIPFLNAMGKTGFKIVGGWRSEPALQRIPTLTRLARVTYPTEQDTPEAFTKQMKAEIAKKSFPEDRLIELAFLAPQWSKHVQHYFGWPGMAEALYWYLAHMNFMWSSNTVENAAESAGFVEQGAAPATESAAATEDDSHEQVDAPKVEVLSPWEQLVRERTALTKTERDDGAIDVDWFHRVYKEIGAKKWERIAKAAKFAANAAQAKKATLIANVLLGEADLKALIEGVETRFLKDYVRLIGLFPLPKGAKREAELAKRHKVLVNYGRYAKQLSGLTKPAALRALEIGLKNLASTAGFEDALRLDWALGASEWADLAKGPVKASKEGTEVTLVIDEHVMPVITVTKNGKELKAAPAAVKKEPKVAVLFERAKELRRQSSRQKQALEAAMLRGDEFSSTELVQLCEHALVAPFLTRLVLVGDGVMGYPDKGGKVLRDFDGKLEPVKKGERLRIAHCHDLFASKQWDQWQRDCFAAERIQPFKQVFRELYVATSQEKSDGYKSNRYAGQQVQPRQAAALFGSRSWNTGEGVFKVFHREGIVAWVSANSGVTTPLEVEGWTIESVHFAKRGEWKPMSMKDVPPRIFSEVMRDVDLVVSVAHRGGVDPEASASTVEMRASLLRETCQLLKLDNVRVQEQYALIDGFHANYSLHLGSGSIHRLPGGYLCVVPVHSQHRGRLFLPFADDDPRTAEVISKSLLLARDKEISDPSILEQLRA